MARRTALMSGLAALALVALAACGGGSSSSGGEGQVTPDKGGIVTGAPTANQSREIIRYADIALRVDDVRATVRGVTDIAASAGGRVANESIDAMGQSEFATLTLRVPAATLDETLQRIGALGTVTSLIVNSEDVTTQAVDLDARIAALQTSVNRLTELLAEAKNTTDLLAIEQELSARQAELDSLTAQRKALSDQVALSTVNVSIAASTVASRTLPPGFAAGFETGWNALQTVVAAVITVAGFAVPFLLAFLVIAVPIALVIVLVRRARRR